MARRDDGFRLLGVIRRNRPALTMSTALLMSTALQTCLTFLAAAVALPANAQPAPNARPTGGNVVAGAASISQTPNQTVIDQSSQRGAINWQSYNVGGAQRVVYNQPSSNSVTLNRVVGPDPSQIAGRIDANGQIILINQSGVNFYKGAQVNTAGLIVTTANATDSKFMAGGPISFDQPGNPNARIDNQGNITVKQAGLAALVAPRVANSGTITAQLGHVVLAGAKTATLDLYGDGLLSLDVSNQVTHAPVGRDGKAATALVTNTGVIVADGGTVQLTARAADGIVQTLVQAGGTLRAATMGDQTGVVALNGVGGSIVVQGQLAAPGTAPGTKGGGAIEVVSDGNVTVASRAKLDASGNAGGGVVAIGTNFDRSQVAANTAIHSGATITVNAEIKGNGGHVMALAENTTSMAGTIAAKGGKQRGDGGLVEVSGKSFGPIGTSDESAPAGHAGSLLLDPTNLDIVATSPSGTNVDAEFSDHRLPFGAADAGTTPSTITAANLKTLGATGNVIVQATGTIDVQNSVTVANGLLLQAGGDLLVDRGVTIQSQAHTLGLDAGFDFVNRTFDKTGAIWLGTTGSGSAPQLRAVNLTLHAGIGINLKDAVLTVSNVTDINTRAGAVAQAAAGALTTATLQSSAGVSGDTLLTSVSNAIGTIGALAVSGGDFALANNGNPGSLLVAGPVSARAVAISNANTGTISVVGSIGANTGTVALASGSGGIAITGGTITAATTISLDGGGGPIALTAAAVLGNSGATVRLATANASVTEDATSIISAATLAGSGTFGNISLTGAANSIGTLAGFATNGAFALKDDAGLTVAGLVFATGHTYIESSNASGITIGTNGQLAAGANDIVSVQTDRLTIGNPGNWVLAGKIFELAPDTSGAAVNLGTGGGLSLMSLAGIAPTTVRLGAVTRLDAASPTTTAGTIVIGGGFGNTATALDLESSGAINGTGGALAASVLSGNAGSVVLTNIDNTIGTLTAFSTTAGFALTDSEALLVAGPVKDTGAASTLALTTATGGMTLAGTVSAANILDLISAGSILQTGGVILAGTLTGSANLANLVMPGNIVASLGPFTTASGFSLVDSVSVPLTVTGAVSGGLDASIIDTAGLTIGSSVSASAISLTATNISIPGLVTSSGSVNLVANSGTISETGILTAGTLSGSASGSVNLLGMTQAANQVASIHDFSANGFTLNNGVDLLVSGNLNGGPNATVLDKGSLTIAMPFNLLPSAQGAAVTARAINLTASNITLSGLSSDGGSGTTSLIATAGTISATGTVIAGTLSGSAKGAVSFSSGSNQIGTVSNFAASSFELTDGADLTVTGSVNGGSNVTLAGARTITVAPGGVVTGNTVGITANGDVSLLGTVQDANGVSLVSSTGSISQTGTLIADLLTGSAAGDASLTGTGTSNKVVQLASFAAGGALILNDGTNLTIAGQLSAPTIIIDSGAGRLTLADRATITTGGIARPVGGPTSFPGDPPGLPPGNGTFLTTAGGFTQQGTSTILGFAGGPSVLRINATGTADISFAATGGLQGPNTWLILALDAGAAAGPVTVRSLDVLQIGASGSTNLTGTIGGLQGFAAAGAAGIQPGPNSNFRFNTCPIHAVSCVLLPGEAVPLANPLNDIYFSTLFNPNDEGDLLLPIVSDQDY